MDSKDSTKKQGISLRTLLLVHLLIFVIFVIFGYFVKYGKYLPGDFPGAFYGGAVSFPLLIIISIIVHFTKGIRLK